MLDIISEISLIYVFAIMLISRAPLRISFFGGGTDYPKYFKKYGGAVLATSIDKYVYNTVSEFPSHLFDYNIRLSYRDVELVKNRDEIKHVVFRECLKYMGLDKDIELHTVADLPSFTGLGSSSSFTVSLLKVLHAYKGLYYKPLDVAYQAIDVEQNILKENVGCQDQVIAAIGGFNYIEFRKSDDISYYSVPIKKHTLEELENNLFLIFTRIKRKADKVAGKQVENIEKNRDILKAMRKMVDDGYDIVTDGKPLSKFGELLDESWKLKRQLDDSISNKVIDAIYQKGMESGALGAKLLGAGSGGFMLFYVPEERHQKFIKNFEGSDITRTKMSANRAEIIFSA